jgi:DnaJ-class molecular chaperone
MASRNYYVVLGVASDETEHGVRTAFRDLARQYHPDRMGPEGATPFREIAEAYEVLGDAERRREYDDSLRRARVTPGETLVRRVSMRRDLADARPSEAAMFRRFERNFTGVGVPRAEGVEALNVEVAISEEEASKGTRVRLGVPVFAPCWGCRGRGCDACGGHGTTEGERPITLSVPPMSGGGTTFVMPLAGLGIHNFYLRVRVRVDKATEPPTG